MSNKENDKIYDGLMDGTISPESEQGELLSDRARKNEHAVALGRLGGIARAKALSKIERIEIAKKAGSTRWHKKPEKLKVELV